MKIDVIIVNPPEKIIWNAIVDCFVCFIWWGENCC